MEDDILLARWLAGELNTEELAALEKSAGYADLQRIKNQLDSIAQPQFDQQKLLREVLAAEKPSKVIPLYRRAWVSIAAVVAVVFGLAYFYTRPIEKSTADGESYAFVLPDESNVTLNSASTASYSRWNWQSNREISLDGEAYFRVAKGKKFTVITKSGSVTVLGTQFNVRVRNGKLRVACYEGRVRVKSGSAEVVLLPSQQIAFENGKASAIIRKNATEPEWLHGELVFSNENLQDVIAELSRIYGFQITIEHRPKQLFSGSLPGNDLEAAIGILESAYHLKAVRSGKNIMFKPADGN